MKGYEVDVENRRIRFLMGARVVTTTDGRMVNLLPGAYEDTFDVVFPDVPKAKMHIHSWDMVARAPNGADGSEWSRAHVTALPQEWEQTTNIVAVPADVDFIAALVRITRTVDPSHPWIYTYTLTPKVKTGVWIPLTGSFRLERAIGFRRIASLYVEDGYFKLHQQQSIGAHPGGWGAWGTYGEPPGINSAFLSGIFPTHVNGGETVEYDGGKGWPLWYGGDVAPYYRTANYSAGGGYFSGGANNYYEGLPTIPTQMPMYMRLSSGSTYDGYRASTNDPTDMGSTYEFEVIGRFGRVN